MSEMADVCDFENKKPIIVQVVREMKPGGGVSGVSWNLERAFRALGYECRRFTLEDIGFRSKSASKSFVLGKLKLLRDVFCFSIFGTLVLKKRYGRKAKYVIVCHNDPVFGEIYINHGLHKAFLFRNEKPWLMLLRNPLHLFLFVREEIRHRFNIHKKTICFSRLDEVDLKKYYPVSKDYINIIPNGVDIVKFKPESKIRDTKRLELGVAEDEFVLIFVASRFTHKGLRLVIKSLKLLPEKVVLWVLGGTSEEVYAYKHYAIREGVEGRVRFWGMRSDTPMFFCSADVLVLPSKFESWALVGLEAMSSGIPVLMTNVGGIGDYLRDGENGFFIERDSEDIAEKIGRLVHGRDLCKAMGESARQTALEYDWNIVARRYIDLIDLVWEGRPQDD